MKVTQWKLDKRGKRYYHCTIADTTVVINVSMTTPWYIMDQLQNWASLLQDHIDKLPLSSEQMKEFQKKSLYRQVEIINETHPVYILYFHDIWCFCRWQTYTEPGDELDNGLGSSPTKRTSRTVVEAEEELEPAPDGVLARN